MSGIAGFGACIPRYRLRVTDIWEMWINQMDTPAVIKERRGLTEKVVGRWDEDAVTMGVFAAKASLENAQITGRELNALYFGSCTNPYASKASSTIIADALTDKKDIISADIQYATKSGAAALMVCAGMVDSGIAGYAMAIGADALSRHIPPNDSLEYSASSGAAAFILSKKQVCAEISHIYAYNTNTPEFFRLEGERYIKHAASEDGEYLWGYERHVKEALANYFAGFSVKSNDFKYVAISQPDAVLPLKVGEEAGITEAPIKPGLLAGETGDFGSASALLSLQAILEQAKPDEKILLVSYGFGAGCDIMELNTTSLIVEVQRRHKEYASVREQINDKEYISYGQYLKQERKLIQEFI